MGTNLLRRFSGDILCPEYGFCSNPKILPDDFEKFKKEILKDKPPRIYPDVLNSSTPNIKFAVITDMHVDMGYSQVW